MLETPNNMMLSEYPHICKVSLTNSNGTAVAEGRSSAQVLFKTGKVSAIRFSTLSAICKALDCQPGDVLEYQPDIEEPPDQAERM